MSYCPSCGDNVNSDAAFCASCGTELGGSEQSRSGQQSSRNERESGDGASRTNTSGSSGTGGTYSLPDNADRTPHYGSIPLGLGFVSGIVAFVAGYAVTWVQKYDQAANELGQLSQLGIDAAPEAWQGVGWVFIAMHNATVEMSGSGPGGSISETIGSGQLQEQWLLLVPVIALVGAGYYVASNGDIGRTSGAKAGASIVSGYFVCVVALAFLSTWTLSTTLYGQSLSYSVGPKLAESIGIAGLGYPVVLGAIGGALGDS
jgi:hypothetical protein